MLESVGDTSNVPIPVAIETPRGVLVSALPGMATPPSPDHERVSTSRFTSDTAIGAPRSRTFSRT
jgi:hypothetical protein